MTSNVELRDYAVTDRCAEHGRTRVTIQCPFCGRLIEAYVWSLASRGKRCDCGALFNRYGVAEKTLSKEKVNQKSRRADETARPSSYAKR
jgi:hypothetical protein